MSDFSGLMKREALMFKYFKELQRYKAAWLKLYHKLKELEKVNQFHGLCYENQMIELKAIINWMEVFMDEE